ncbi:M1 family metallopeptidase [Solirubrobacter phytolaccae]|uniref:Aminopeptidase N n=1 Tax=Solirubrobacter phytolaccae TaxID=1404360 RepID=A0A9X3NCW4_9ACTN|nr:M1 family metallopeptidase [Solirubrobacter phytolaccae]MDA0182542.1 M1 family metallopeptidase [Solirubrobacter phytolaccae]
MSLRSAAVIAAAGGALAAAAPSHAAAPSAFTPGARSLGDSLFPTIGNGGYDVRHYDLDLDYAVARKRLEGIATIDATATQGLSRLSFDLSTWNKVRGVTVDGRPARFTVDAKRSKLVITPARGLRDGRRFRVVVRYGGIQRALKGRTALTEGWVPNAKTGAVVVAQPTGAMGWYPNNNVPADKATYTTRVTVPRGWSALATGVLTARRTAGRGKRATSTFVWNETAPTSSFLVSVAVGKFDVNSLSPTKPKRTTPAAGSLNKPLPFYTAITSSLPAQGKAQSATDLGRSSEIVDFYSTYYGKRYPFTSVGGIVTLQSFGLGLETQGKPTYAITEIDSTYGPGVDLVAHELAHQFFGNLVTPARWRDVWLSEGMAVFSAWVWSSTGTFFPVPPRDRYLDVYANPEYPISWRVAPADPATPRDLFDGDGIYRRAPATIEAIREILGNDGTFKAMMRRWLTDHAYGSATTEQFIALVKRTDPARSARWTEFFRQWLYTSYPTADGVPKPQMHVDNFDTYPLPAG